MTTTTEINVDHMIQMFVDDVRSIPANMVDSVLLELAELNNVEVGSDEYINIKNGISDVRYISGSI